jgi:hypothetical protein
MRMARDEAVSHHDERRERTASDSARKELASLIAAWPWELGDTTIEGQAWLLQRLRRSLRIERQRGITGHWTYDLTRHARLLRAYRSELASFKARGREQTRTGLARQAPGT